MSAKVDRGTRLFSEYTAVETDFPDFPKNKLDFISLLYNNIPDTDYTLVPYQYWIDIMKSKKKRMYLLMARQLFKTTFFALSSAYIAATIHNSTTAYVAPDEDKLSTYADQKYRSDLLNASPILKSCIFGNHGGLPGRRSKVQWKNGSFNWHVTDEGGYRKIEGKSGDLTIYDEYQIHDAASLPKAKEAMSKKIGDEYFGGVGGEYGSVQEATWLDTTQSEWHYSNEEDYVDSAGTIHKNQGWRNELQFGPWEDNLGEKNNGLIYGTYMNETCKGYWEETSPENESFPGYHLSQLSACHVPLSISDAINLYKIPKEYSIEYKEMNYPRLMTIAHVHGLWYKAPRKPITRTDALATLEPYRYLYFMSGSDIQDFKTVFPERVKVLFGADWGSGNDGQGQTVFTIILKWLGINEEGKLSPDRDRYFVIYQERLPYELSETLAEAYHGIKLFREYHCDYGAADLGYGVKQVKTMQEGGYDTMGNKIEGLGYSKFIGTWTRGKITKVEEDNPGEIDDEGSEEITHLLIDKTSMMEDFINMVKWKVPHPNYHSNESLQRRKLAIAYGDEWRTYPLIKDFTQGVMRTDIEEDFLTVKPITTESPKIKYAHPPDSVVSISHCFIADNHFSGNATFQGTFSKSSTTHTGVSSFRGTRR